MISWRIYVLFVFVCSAVHANNVTKPAVVGHFRPGWCTGSNAPDHSHAYGNVLHSARCLFCEGESLVDEDEEEELDGILEALEDRAAVALGRSLHVECLIRIDLVITIDDGPEFGKPLKVNIEGDRQSFQLNATMGVNFYATVKERDSGLTHILGWTYSEEDKLVVIHHTMPNALPDVADTMVAEETKLRVLTYNVWNTNPPLSKDWPVRQRLARYTARMSFIAEYLEDSNADVIALQEVRYDHTLQVVAKSQVESLATVLAPLGYDCFVCQAAMSYTVDVSSREEEGLCIFSKYPIVDSSYMLLSRDLSK